ncbi:MAG: hypothetical protein GY814_05325 [Gammaproteobacteria bacterium]|nr:hypothetical protein [Gammaproteobacteria bacterium]
MSLVEETHELRSKLTAWATDPEWLLLIRYDLRRNKPPHSLVERWYQWMRNVLARLRVMPPYVTEYSWLPTLKHAQVDGDYTILLIWAVDVERDELRLDCEGFIKHLEDTSGLVPVLVTNTADFAYFSRLKWLVEYVPSLRGEGSDFDVRKQHYLAWRYSDALVVPVSAGRASTTEWRELLEMVH